MDEYLVFWGLSLYHHFDELNHILDVTPKQPSRYWVFVIFDVGLLGHWAHEFSVAV